MGNAQIDRPVTFCKNHTQFTSEDETHNQLGVLHVMCVAIDMACDREQAEHAQRSIMRSILGKHTYGKGVQCWNSIII